MRQREGECRSLVMRMDLVRQGVASGRMVEVEGMTPGMQEDGK